MTDTPNRYGAEGIHNEDGDPSCCHGRSLGDTCDGCVDLEATDREPSLVGVDPARMNPLNDDDPGREPLDAGDLEELESNDELSEEVPEFDEFSREDD